ncbi:MAG TPA: hypothetical protein PKD49_11185 [Hyphomicrobium sp.]|nr:hypothetical protein [Hyphomicrobium sp.]
MLQAKSRRGRPKGTGIDDSDRIARLAELIRVHPELKPTTAIRVMGITDPSVIRRLRDKYTAYLRNLSVEKARARAVAAQPPAAPAQPQTQSLRH